MRNYSTVLVVGTLVFLLTLTGYFGITRAQSGATTQASDSLARLLKDSDGQLSQLAESLLGKNGGDRLFYLPTRDIPHTPRKFGYKYEDVHFRSSDGTQLHGWFLPAHNRGEAMAKATIVFSHGNTGSIGHHLGFVDWLVVAGYNVLLYDYRAFGQSQGFITRKGLVEDVHAAFKYVASREHVDGARLVSFSHSLGGAKSLTAIGMKPIKGLRAVITDGAFASYKQMAAQKAGRVGANLTTDDFSPIDYVQKIAPVPLLMVHGEDDRVVPVSQGDTLFKVAKQPKTYFRIRAGGHSNSLAKDNGKYRKRMLAWLDEVLAE